jgi:ABC-type Fe3+/spermidine/putrescine transport system ATPase subunit
MAIAIKCAGVDFKIDNSTILSGVSLNIPAGHFYGIVGPSGAGKTTLLRLLAGLDEITNGSINFYDHNNQSIIREKQTVSLLFQSLALWPHITVKQHVDLVISSSRRQYHSDEVLIESGIPKSLWYRYPHQLSAGESQRVALARAIATQPTLLLVDEPLVNVDPPLRSQIQLLLRNIHKKFNITIVYVTHRWEEITGLCESVAVLDQGSVIQEGSVNEVYWHPVTEHCANFTGDIVNIAFDLIDSGLIDIENKSTEKQIRFLNAVRPQQIAFIKSHGSNSWKILTLYPFSFGWCYKMQSKNRTITLKSSEKFNVGDNVGIMIKNI